MSPVQAGHIRSVRILLEEHMIFPVIENSSMRFVGPCSRRHTMESRTQDIRSITFRRISQDRGVLSLLINYFAVDTLEDFKIIYQAIISIQAEKPIHLIILERLAYHEICSTTIHATFLTLGCSHLHAIVVHYHLLVFGINGYHQMIPLVTRQFVTGFQHHLPALDMTDEHIGATGTQAESKSFITTLHHIQVGSLQVSGHRSKPLAILIQPHHRIRLRCYPKRECHLALPINKSWVYLSLKTGRIAIQSPRISLGTSHRNRS